MKFSSSAEAYNHLFGQTASRSPNLGAILSINLLNALSFSNPSYIYYQYAILFKNIYSLSYSKLK